MSGLQLDYHWLHRFRELILGLEKSVVGPVIAATLRSDNE